MQWRLASIAKLGGRTSGKQANLERTHDAAAVVAIDRGSGCGIELLEPGDELRRCATLQNLRANIRVSGREPRKAVRQRFDVKAAAADHDCRLSAGANVRNRAERGRSEMLGIHLVRERNRADKMMRNTCRAVPRSVSP